MKTTPLHTRKIEDRLRDALSIEAENWRHVSLVLVQRADAEGLIDVAYERHDSPLGSIVVAATHDGLVRIGLPIEGEDAVIDELAHRISGRILHAPRTSVNQARCQLDEYFELHRTQFDLARDWQLTGGFRRQVLAATAEIPYGQTASYRDVALARGARGPFAPPAPRWPPTRYRSSCRAIACSRAADSWAPTGADQRQRLSSSSWRGAA